MDSTEHPSRAGRILVGVDSSAGSRAALRWALREAAARSAAVTALAAWAPVGPTPPYAPRDPR
jgi:nucleotide-binding universal stress UspA family protein